jgi:DNA-binding transcriptional LysR family regulator
MSLPAGLDAELLRAFVFVAEDRSFTRAGQRIGRTQAAISMQMQKLETQLGEILFLRGRGEGVELTPHGSFLLERAREMLAINDGIWSTFRAPAVSGLVRLGTPDDYALQFLPDALRRFAESHPAVEVEVVCAPSEELVERLKAGRLDLTLLTEGSEPKRWPFEPLMRGPLVWVTSERFAPHRQDPLPLALAEQDCVWRRAILRALEKCGRRYRVAYVSSSVTGTMVPVVAGLAVTCAIAGPLPQGVRVLPRQEADLPELPEFSMLMLKAKAPPQPVTDRLAAHITEVVAHEGRRNGEISNPNVRRVRPEVRRAAG